ncbi:hypothetical protein [Palleronia caenipelagi]|uniref:Uncharacterized protein n=1 Tax=Palleronia caenipelagi TaxID=2489174 RepID=A0A547PNT5_9RHOB|nr:hypothetical protein [Palleronia caenipelagi]TRD15779.1 hypothetical protein FEV53_15065 [Palleronia caenipelagi]
MTPATLPLTHQTISPEAWLDLVDNIDAYRDTTKPSLDSDLHVALHIAQEMARVSRKQGVKSYTEDDVLNASKPELQGPWDSRQYPLPYRSELFGLLASVPFVEVLEEDGSRRLRQFI